MIKKRDSSWLQIDSNVVCTVTHIRKKNFQNWLLMSPRTILCCTCALETFTITNDNEQTFQIIFDNLDFFVQVKHMMTINR